MSDLNGWALGISSIVWIDAASSETYYGYIAWCFDVAGSAVLGYSNTRLSDGTSVDLCYSYNGGAAVGCGKFGMEIETGGDGEGLGDVIGG